MKPTISMPFPMSGPPYVIEDERRPTISTLIPVGPGYVPCWLRRAIQSTLDQEGGFEHDVVVWMDGPPFPSGWSDWPKTVRFVGTDVNMGVEYALNSAVEQATGQYIARLDADDFSLPTRYAKQLAMLKDGYDVVGTGMQVEYGVILQSDAPAHDLLCRNQTPIWHPTMMIKREHMLPYPKGFEHAEDMALHCLLVKKGLRYGNVPEPLVNYGRHDGQMSIVHRSEQKANSARAVQELYLTF